MHDEIKKHIKQVRQGEVPEGYKRTRAGIMPTKWVAPKAHGIFQSHTNKKHGGDFEVLSATQDRGVIPRSKMDIDIKYAKESVLGYKKVDIGDFVISLRSFQGGIEYSEYEGLVSPAYTVLKPIKPISNEYYKAYFKTNDFISRLNGAVYGIRDGKQIGYEDFGDLVLHYPPVAEQQKIAEILSLCDKVIDLKKQLVEEKHRRKRWLMENLLNPDSGIGLPGFKKSKWQYYTMNKLGTFYKGTGISNEDCDTGDFPCVKYGDIYTSYDAWFIQPVSSTEPNIAESSHCVGFGALLFTGSGEDRLEIGKCTAYLGENKIAIGGDIVIMEPNKDIVEPLFLAYMQYTENLIRQKARIGQGYSIVHIYASDIKKLTIEIPPTLDEQRAIVSVLLNIDREINLLEQELAEWQKKKKSLMQLLLTGLVRVQV